MDPEDIKPEGTEGSESDVNQQTANVEQSDTVELHQASIEDIDAELARLQAEEAGQPVSEGDNSEGNTNSYENQPGQAAIQPQGRQADVATQGASPQVPQTMEAPKEPAANTERRGNEGIQQKESFIQSRRTELAALHQKFTQDKRILMERRDRLAEGLNDRLQESPSQGLADRDEIQAINAKLEEIDTAANRAQRIADAQVFFVQHVDLQQVSLNDLAAVLKEADGVSDQDIAQFKANPWEWIPPEGLVQLGRRAMERKQFTQADADRKLLARYVNYLKEENNRLRGKPGQVINQVQKHLNGTPSVTAKSNVSAASGQTLNAASIPHLSNEELDRALKAAMMH